MIRGFCRDKVLASLAHCGSAYIPMPSGDYQLIRGHLASSLDVPTITISCSRKPLLWRPDWAQAAIIKPMIRINWFKRKIWAPFISQHEILRTINRLTKDNSNPL